MVRETIVEMLQRAGYEALAAVDGGEGLAPCHEKKVDLVITDIIMPDVEGIEIIRMLLQERPHIKIIAISGGDRISYRDLLRIASHFGAYKILKKPFERSELLDAITEVLFL